MLEMICDQDPTFRAKRGLAVFALDTAPQLYDFFEKWEAVSASSKAVV